jgi:large subunit ribosomal protein L9e|uniref:Large ribosomal subunit protein uL6 alpha-beta domain-containing protein n=1 Tax=Mantoniella antarctica TaxID=81844 RepID=A0A7S0XAG4_9CHLO|mmetsp:Transcript_26358/g.66047  ORF Transcript_26358/g.66047 Transcript_26358/m.66047 type:complete len:189 (+) Transcript_26358:77-643(+)
MKVLKAQRIIAIPDGVEVTLKARKISVKGPRGSLSRDFTYMPRIDIHHDKEESKVVVTMYFSAKKRLAVLRTVCSHMLNLFDGVTKGFRYKMRAVYAHFPVNVNIGDAGEKVEIRNFLGEKRTRTCMMQEGVKIARDAAVKDCLVIEGNDIDKVSKSAALIHMSCLVKKKDIRKFLDGFYVSEKGVIE